MQVTHAKVSAIADSGIVSQVQPSDWNADHVVTLTASDVTGALGYTPGTGNGTVTSVAFSAPAEFTVSGSPVTGGGTLTFSKANQNTNLFFAGPTTGSPAAPTFRSIVAADIPTLNQNTTGQAGTVATITSGQVTGALGFTPTNLGSFSATSPITYNSGTGAFGFSAAYAGQSSIVTVGTLTAGATGVGFTVGLGTSTISGVLPAVNGGAGTVNGIMKANGSGTVSAASVGTDYMSPSTAIAVSQMTTNVNMSGTYNSRPSAGTVGRFYFCTDTYSTYFDNGSAWIPITPPPGTIIDFAGSSPPSGYIACDGSQYSQTASQYAALYAAIGTAWNTFRGQSGPSAGNFRVPLMNGLVKGGAGSSGTNPTTSSRSLAGTAGQETVTLSTANLPSHNHNYATAEITYTVTVASGNSYDVCIAIDNHGSNQITASTGSGTAFNNMTPTAFVNFYIKL